MKRSLLVFFSFCLFMPSVARAGGFYLQEQSVSNQGAAFAGAGADPRDASTIFYNPAGLTALPQATSAANVSLVMPQADFTNKGSTAGLNAGAQAAYAGPVGGDPFSPEAIPALYAAAPVDQGKRYWIGLGISTPFGLSNKYDTNWFGRYDSTESNLRDIDISPVFAAKINDKLSLGGGVDVQHVDVLLRSALPCPSVAFGCGAAFSPASDGTSSLEGDSWAVGFNAGALWQPEKETRVGVFYRSAVRHDLEGTATVQGLGGALAAQNGVRGASAALNTPEVATLSIAQDINERLTLLGSYNWFGWNNFKEIRVKFDDGAADYVTPQDYRNSYALALGAEWKQTEALTLRTGVQYDKTPTTDGARTTRTPDGDRYWLSVGAGYAFNNALSLDAAAAHVFMKDGDINLSRDIYAGTAAASTNLLQGASKNSLDILSLQLRVNF